jgi:hypothetical protein
MGERWSQPTTGSPTFSHNKAIERFEQQLSFFGE